MALVRCSTSRRERRRNEGRIGSRPWNSEERGSLLVLSLLLLLVRGDVMSFERRLSIDDDAVADASCGRSISFSCCSCDDEEDTSEGRGCCGCELSSAPEANSVVSVGVEYVDREWPYRDVDVVVVNANDVVDGEIKREARAMDLAIGEIIII